MVTRLHKCDCGFYYPIGTFCACCGKSGLGHLVPPGAGSVTAPPKGRYYRPDYPDDPTANVVDVRFTVGTVVRLKSGSPDMTVLLVEGSMVVCRWFEGPALRQAVFPADMLTTVEG